MHLLIPLVVAAGGVLTAGLPQYQPPSSLQQFYKAPPPAYGPRPVQDPQNPMYTYAEVNTPYYQYHYYSPAYKNHHIQPPLLEAPPPEISVRNEVNSYANVPSTTLKSLFYPATNIPIGSPESGYQNNGYSPGYEPRAQPFYPKFSDRPEVSITSKPLNVNNVFAPVLRTYKAPMSNNGNPSLVAPVSIPTALATGFPNILRETYGNDRNPESPLIYQASSVKPDLMVPVYANPNLAFKPTVVPESLATPSSTIIRDEVRRRGISSQFEFQDKFSSSSKNPSVENSQLNTDSVSSSSTLSPQFRILPENSTKEEDLQAREISANILRVFSSPNLEFPLNHISNTSVEFLTESVIKKASNVNILNYSSFSFNQSNPSVSTETPTNTTLSHRQKISKKVNPTVVPKKFLAKHPNVLFYSPGHDVPK